MWDFVINMEINKTLKEIDSIPFDKREDKFKDLLDLTKKYAPKGSKRELKNNIFRIKKKFKFQGLSSSLQVKAKKPIKSKMGNQFTNFGNFGRKISEYNEERKEKNREKLQMKVEKAEKDAVKAAEEKELLKRFAKAEKTKQETKALRNAKLNKFLDKAKKIGDKSSKKSSSKKSKSGNFDILGGSNSKNGPPELLGNNNKDRFKI